MEKSFSDIEKFYKLNLATALATSAGQDEFNIGINCARKILEKSKCNLSGYFAIINGKKENTNISALNFPKRFIKGNLDNEQTRLLNTIIIDCFMVGYIYHFIDCTFPTRDRIELVDFERLYNTWLVKSIVADIVLKKYNKNVNNAPVIFFELYYKTHKCYDKVFTDRFKIGHFKNWKVYSFMRNIMFSGALYGMSYDLATKEN